MKFVGQYTLSLTGPHHHLALPLEFQHNGWKVLVEGSSNPIQLQLRVEGRVNSASLELTRGPASLTGEPGQLGIRVAEKGQAGELARDTADLLSLATGSAVSLSIKTPLLLAENDDDRSLLESMGTTSVYRSLSAAIQARGLSFGLDEHTLTALLSRRVGLRIYADAQAVARPVAKFREYWRLLESAFAAKDRRLTSLLARYPPAIRLGWTDSRLRDMLILRGRASHAESRLAMRELIAVESAASEAIGRVRSLAEEVLMTKGTWGSRDLGTERLGPTTAIIRADGSTVFFVEPGQSNQAE